MKTQTRRRRARQLAARPLVTTLGDLISAVYESVPGIGEKRRQQALWLLTRSPLARHMSPHVEFVP